MLLNGAANWSGGGRGGFFGWAHLAVRARLLANANGKIPVQTPVSNIVITSNGPNYNKNSQQQQQPGISVCLYLFQASHLVHYC